MSNKAITTMLSLMLTDLNTRSELLETRIGAKAEGINFKVSNLVILDEGITISVNSFVCIIPESTVILRLTKEDNVVDIDCSSLFLLYGEPGDITILPKALGLSTEVKVIYSTDT